ncbi:hypothetical protein N7455_008271 [Penicillium solitum]|uniref:uncharacterized protein n=1 Tax=Penicillium solitum TaxID=60172 RepID=UPI0017FAEF91|nr:hypothetical protein HAV15_004671 [Penicillium sp. str. \
MSIPLILVARFLEPTNLLFIAAESSLSPPTFKRQAQQALDTPASRIPRHQLAHSTARDLSGSQASQAHNTSLCLTPIPLITMCILPLLPMTLGSVGQDSAVHVRIFYMGANRSFPSPRVSYTITSLPPGYTSNPPSGS